MLQSENSYKYLVAALIIILFIPLLISPPVNNLSWDVFGYYLYLPAKFIHHDIALQDKAWLDALIAKYQPTATLYQAVKIENGNWIMKYSMGLAIAYAPFFFIANAIAEPLGYPADGLSLPYQYCLTIGSLIYAAIGLVFLGKILRMFFSNRLTMLLLIVVFFGTNYLQMTAFGGALLSHTYLFTFYAVLVYYTIQWHKQPKLKYAAAIGICIGFMTLMRPTEIICALIPLLWNIKDKASLIVKINLVKQYWWHIAAIAVLVVIMGLPQLYYWKRFTGHYFFYSYTNPGEGLDFLSPHTINFLFSFRKGWFIYTPIMLFAMVGFYFLYKYKREIFYPFLVFFLLDVYLISSWTNWWYAGGSYSSRSILPAYVLLILPLGYFVQWVKSLNRNARIIMGVLCGFLIILNLFQTWQFQKGIISKERMTRAYYFATFGKTSVSAEDEKLLLVDRSVDEYEYLMDEENYTKKILYQNHFEDTVPTNNIMQNVLVMNDQLQYSPGINIKFKDLTTHDHAWLRTSIKVFLPDSFADAQPILVVTFHHKDQGYKYATREIAKDKIKLGAWNDITMDYITPEVRSGEDNVKVYLWYTGKQPIFVDDLVIELFEPKN